MTDQKRALRWQARVEWRDGRKPLTSPELPWRLMKSFLDGVLSADGPQVERIVVNPCRS